MRLIDADAFLHEQIRRCHCVPLVGSSDRDCESLKLLLDQTPTVNAVVHGTYSCVPGDDFNPPYYICDICGCKSEGACHDEYTFYFFHYCPNCGAKMDLEG